MVKNAEVFGDLDEAVADLTWVMGTTGKEDIGNEELLRPELAVAELGSVSEQGKVGIVFGCENHGLTNAQLKTLDRLAHIPTRPDCTFGEPGPECGDFILGAGTGQAGRGCAGEFGDPAAGEAPDAFHEAGPPAHGRRGPA